VTDGPARLSPLTQYALLAGPLLSMLDSSVVNVAVEPIARQLQASLTTVQWVVSGYLLALGAGLAATAYLARRFGTLVVYRTSVSCFTAASFLCAVAPSADLLVGARVLQGLVAAPLVPLAMSMLLGDSGGSRSVSPLAGMLLFLGPAIGPTVGGALIGVAGWRSIFLINVPFGVAAALSVRFVPSSLAPGRVPGARFDLPGLVLLAAGLTALLFGATSGFSGARTWLPLGTGVVLLAGYVAWAARREQPALDLSLARQRGSALSMALCALASIVTWAAVFLLPVFVQSAQGRGALAAGLTMAPQGLITGLSTAFGPRLLGRVSLRVTVLAGFAVLAVASLGLWFVGSGTPLWVIAVILACRSVSIGLVINPLLQAFTQPLRQDQLGDANTLFNAWQRVAGSFGIGIIAVLYGTAARAHGPVAALHQAAIVITAIAAVGAAGSLALPAGQLTSTRGGGAAPRRGPPVRG
jgi:EmrB/QacA subfamily drug resistance transporter